ncbi:MAG: sulfate ABC transporter ATP-binding protein [Castellaniella sp.]|uniref:sulfate/molybdate ABC transporter ATP-binding protein n=1 Tax=Castellaniella sp. TaxID=1955812 RepID=UPI0011F7CFB2|nr:sulfate ABC transporter ATP-binding protein [Castellaniella sp.]TAN28676.1 MAG: sulfate ABC transporter ATP-binding protein [Castellaniella sp.]
MSIEVRHIHKRFGAFTALDDVSLSFPDGRLTALLGPSGCGKTTLLRIIAGLEHADQGQVLLGGQDASRTHVRHRHVGFVFQHYALFKHMSVFENVAFGLRVKPREQRPSKQDIRKKVMDLLELVQLDWLADRRPAALSGGQRQRIALARALAVEPRVLLLDEPFGALDAKVRKELRRWLRRLHDELQVTSIFVTHDQEEALEVSDDVVIMNQGRVEQIGTPQAVYDNPATAFVCGFLGHVNLFQGRMLDGRLQADGMVFAAPGHSGEQNVPGTAFVRPHDIQIEPYPSPATAAAGSSAANDPGWLVSVRRARALGPMAQLELQREDTQEIIEAVMSSREFHRLGGAVHQRFIARPRQARVFPNQPT